MHSKNKPAVKHLSGWMRHAQYRHVQPKLAQSGSDMVTQANTPNWILATRPWLPVQCVQS